MEIRECQKSDHVCQHIVEFCRSGWPEKRALSPEVKPYHTVSAELTVQVGLLFLGSRIVIPPPLRKTLLDRIHGSSGHQGITKCRELARQSIWWPGLSKALEETVHSCRECLKVRQRPQPSSQLHYHPCLGRKWQVISSSRITQSIYSS